MIDIVSPLLVAPPYVLSQPLTRPCPYRPGAFGDAGDAYPGGAAAVLDEYPASSGGEDAYPGLGDGGEDGYPGAGGGEDAYPGRPDECR